MIRSFIARAGMIINTGEPVSEPLRHESTVMSVQFSSNGESPAPSLDVSAELSGAIGAVEQLGAADVAVRDGDGLSVSAPATVVVNAANDDRVTVIRNGHLR